VKIDVPMSDADKKIPLSGMRRTIAERLLASKTQIPHFYLTMEVDAAPLAKLRKDINNAAESTGAPKITVNDFVLLAAARAAAAHPKVNAAFAGDAIVEYSGVHLSVAIAVEDGLVTPVVRAADKLSIRALSAAVKDLATRARGKKLKPEEYASGTLTVSNLGAYGVDNFYAIINPPQSLILAVGAIVKKPVVGPNDQIVAGQRMAISLSGDHRVVDGALGAEYLATVRKMLENPTTLLV
jgi:pyruvate dehydrogenase E2 component (dihydrolipoamide acetyltransferase)